MIIQRTWLAVTAFVALCAAGPVAAAPPANPGNACNTPAGSRNPLCVKAPEIDATAGVQAIALLGGVLLLVGERARRRKV